MRRLPPLALCYHGVRIVPLRHDRSRLFVAPRDLERHIRTLTRWGYRLVSFGELVERARSSDANSLAALTFDDGLACNLTHLVPMLSAAATPATVFVVSGWLGYPHPAAPWARILTIAELRSLSKAGIEVGGHSTQHDHLPDLDRPAAEADMRRCREDLEAIIQKPVRVFAYPFGGATEETMKACAAAGYLAACRSMGEGDWNNPLGAPRQDMQHGSSTTGLWLKRWGIYERLVATRPGLAIRRASRLTRALRP